MNNENKIRLPVKMVISQAFRLLIALRKPFYKVLVIPAMFLISIYFIKYYFADTGYAFLVILNIFSYFIYCYFIISVHRVVLLHENYSNIVIPRPSWRVVKYVLWVVATTLVAGLIAIPIIALNHLMSTDASGLDQNLLMYLLAMLPAAYILARLSLIFPAVALDKRPNFERAWALSKNNGWRLFIVVGVLPYVFTLMQELISREESTIVEDIAIMLLSFIFLIIEITALSLSYKYLVLDKVVQEE